MLRYLTTETQRHRAFIFHRENSVSLCLCGEFIPSYFFIIIKQPRFMAEQLHQNLKIRKKCFKICKNCFKICKNCFKNCKNRNKMPINNEK